jgi:hypothetical protein
LVWDRRIHPWRHFDNSLTVDRRMRERRDTDVVILDDFDEKRRRERPQQTDWRMPERWHTERRRSPPDSWGKLGFLVMRSEDESP